MFRGVETRPFMVGSGGSGSGGVGIGSPYLPTHTSLLYYTPPHPTTTPPHTRSGFAYREHFAAGIQFLVMGVPPLPIVGGSSGAILVVRRQDILELSYENSQNATTSESLDMNVV